MKIFNSKHPEVTKICDPSKSQERRHHYIKSYLDNGEQRVRVNRNFNSWQEIIAGVPQGSILGPLLFNIFGNDLFFFVSSSNLSNYADDNTLCTCGYNLKEVLLNDVNKVTEWFFENYMFLNVGKWHFMCRGKNTENETFIFTDTTMKNSKEEKNTRCYYRQ